MKFMFLNKYSDHDETIPVLVNFDNVCFFYPWDGRNGGTFIDFGGSAVVVKETYEEIIDIMKGASQ